MLVVPAKHTDVSNILNSQLMGVEFELGAKSPAAKLRSPLGRPEA